MKTKTGTPVHFMQWNKKGHWNTKPAVISAVCGAKVSITVIGKKTKRHIDSVRHADFKKKGKDYWDFIPEPS